MAKNDYIAAVTDTVVRGPRTYQLVKGEKVTITEQEDLDALAANGQIETIPTAEAT